MLLTLACALAAMIPLLAMMLVSGCDGGGTPPAGGGKTGAGVNGKGGAKPGGDTGNGSGAGAGVTAVRRVANKALHPEILEKATYVGREGCIKCHADQHNDWLGSHHDLAMDPANDETVLADFDNTSFTLHGVATKFFKRDGKHMVHTEGPDGKMADFEVKYVFGVDPLQQYLVEFPDGRVQCLTVAWDVHKNRWFTLYPDEKIPHDDWLHWTKGGQNWNYMCAECHSTNLQKNYDLATDTYKTTWSEIDVSCEACHGPGSEHEKWAADKSDDASYADDDPKGLAIKLKGADNRIQAEVCARCHSRRRIVAHGYHPGKEFSDHYTVESLRDDLYHADGQILEEVYVFGSFIQSKMFHKGVKCTDCHNPHSNKLVLQGNALCTKCHIPARYDGPQHHFHKVGTEGASCVDCHMPTKTYMQVDPRRDHSFHIPRPQLTIDHGVPNACNGCHNDKKPQWALGHVTEWYKDKPKDGQGGAAGLTPLAMNSVIGGPRADVKTAPPFAPTIAKARQAEDDALRPLKQLAADPQRPAIVRSTALNLLLRYPLERPITDIALDALKDPDPLVRGAAVRNFEPLTNDQLPQVLEPLLADPSRAVRVEAARLLSRVANDKYKAIENSTAKRFWRVLDEYKASQQAVIDQPGAHLNLAVLHENLGDVRAAERSYKKAIEIEKSFVPARLNLASLYARYNRNDDAERLLREAVKLQPDMAEANYTLGLLLAEKPNKLDEAAYYLKRAADVSPRNARMQYNYALAMQHMRRHDLAEPALIKAHKLDRESPDYINALMVLYMQQRRFAAALPYAEMLSKQFPDNNQLKLQVEQIRQQAAQGGR